MDLFTHENIDKEQDYKHFFCEKPIVCGKFFRMRPKSLM